MYRYGCAVTNFLLRTPHKKLSLQQDFACEIFHKGARSAHRNSPWPIFFLAGPTYYR
jgi:hypothetical protein